MQKFGRLVCAIAAVLPLFGVAETYTLAGKDESNASAMNGTGSVGWTDSLGVTTKNHNPSVGNDYVVNQNYILRSPAGKSFAFGGDSLTVSGDSQIKDKGANNSTVTIPNLIVTGKATIANGDANALNKIAGAIDIREDGSLAFDVSFDNASGDARKFEVQSDVSGAGSLCAVASDEVKSAGPYVKFLGSLAGFSGKVAVRGRGAVQFATIFASSLPGDPDDFLEDGLTVEGNSALKFETSGKLGITRGASLGSGACEIYVAEGETVQIDGFVTGSVGFRKTGKGTLALANVSPDLMGTVTVAEGTLQLCDMKETALPAADVTVASGAVLDEHGPAVDHDPLVEATLTGVDVIADGQPHGPVLTVTDPASGYQVEWSTDGGAYVPTRPTFTAPGVHTVFCRVSATGYMARKLRTTVAIRALRRIVATEAEQEGDWANATVAGDDAWSAIQGVIDACGVGDLVLVKAGTYLLTNELAFASDELRGVTLRSDDGEGGLARKTTFLVGGYPATTNRLVRIATPDVIVEGFTLTNGFVNGTCGGGAYLDDCGADAGLRSCDIVGCTAWHEPYVKSSINNSKLGTGGGVYVYNTGCVSNCLIRGNTAFAGGAVYLEGTIDGTKQSTLANPRDVPRVTACTLVENQMVGAGNANAYTGSALASLKTTYLDHSTIISNFCNVAGNVQYSTVGVNTGYLIISNCVFEANHLGTFKNKPVIGANTGNRVVCVGNTFIRERNQILYNDGVCEGCAMIDCLKPIGWNTVRNCFFFANTNKDDNAGCIGDSQHNKLTVENCTFVGNYGAICPNGGGTVASRTNRVVNCLFFDNVKDIYAVNSGNSTPNALFVSNCCIRASSLDMKSGSNHQFGLLVTNGSNIVYNEGQREYVVKELIRFYANGRGDCHLRADSALIGAGMTLGWMDGATDADGNPRVVGGAPDIGCYERQEDAIDPPFLCTRAVATEADKKDEWADAIVGLQAAVDAAYDDEPLYVKAGTYNVAEPITLKNQGVLLIGEGPGATIVDGGYPARTNRLFTITQGGTRIEGMTLRNSAVAADGGAILVSHDDFTLDGCVVSNCCAGFNGKSEPARYGGGVYVDGVYPNVLLTNSLFVSCAARLGGGVAAWKKNTSLSAWATRETVPVVSDCELVANRVYADGSVTSGREGHGQGAGAFGSLWVEHSRFCGNFTKPTDNYAAALTLDSYGVATNCILEGHLSDECATVAGRGDGTGSAKALISQCTFRDNSTPYLVKGIANVENCLIVSNAFTKGNELSVNGTSLFRNCLFACNTGAASVGNSTFENCTFATNEYGICHYKYNDAPIIRNCVSLANTGTVSRLGTYYGTPDFCFERAWSKAVNRKGTYEANVVLGCRELPIYGGAAGETFDLCSVDKTGATSNIVAIVEKKGFKFVDPAKGNWRLRRNSPLRDAAFVLDWMTDSATDLDGKPRRISSDGKAYPDSLPDIGCYECDIPKPGFLLQVR